MKGKKRVISAIAASLAPEELKGARLTFSVSISKDGTLLLLKFSGADVVSLRAGMNTVLRLTLSALKSIEATSSVERQKSLAFHRKTQ